YAVPGAVGDQKYRRSRVRQRHCADDQGRQSASLQRSRRRRHVIRGNGKAGGLTLSPADNGAERAPTAVRPIFDLGEWRRNKEGDFNARLDALVEAAGTAMTAGPEQRMLAQVDLARFYMARGMYPEAVGVLNLALADSKAGSEDPAALIVHSLASILMGRTERGLRDLASPVIGSNYESQLWKALASARQGKWADAR